VRDVTVRFGGLAADEGLSLALRRGEILALIGPNGAGKSTAFNVITGFQPPDRGRVELDGTPITGLAPYRIAERRLVRMFQRTSVFAEAPAFDNVLTACHRLSRTSLGR
jgi:branched-chain amino acid transport system ATP-binding protein